jgi:hypothetical protein
MPTPLLRSVLRPVLRLLARVLFRLKIAGGRPARTVAATGDQHAA